MNNNIHAFAQPYYGQLLRAAERLPDSELDRRIRIHVESREKIR